MSSESGVYRSRQPSDRLASFFGVITDGRSYRSLLYLFVAFPLGYLYFFLYLLAFVLGIVFSFLLIGIPILFAALVGARYIAAFERWLANALLGTDIRRPPPIREPDLWSTAVAYTTDHATWRGLGYIAIKFWLGLLSFILLVVGLAGVFALVTAPTGDSEVLGWTIDSTAESLVAVPVGVLLFFVFLHVCNVAASLSGTVAVALLDEGGRRHEGPSGRRSSRPPRDRPRHDGADDRPPRRKRPNGPTRTDRRRRATPGEDRWRRHDERETRSDSRRPRRERSPERRGRPREKSDERRR